MNSSWWLAVSWAYLYGSWVFIYWRSSPNRVYTIWGAFSGFFMGMLIILISFFIQTGTVTATSILISVPILVLVGAINFSNNIRDLDGDKENGRKTLAILIRQKKAVNFLAFGCSLFHYLWVFGLIITSGPNLDSNCYS